MKKYLIIFCVLILIIISGCNDVDRDSISKTEVSPLVEPQLNKTSVDNTIKSDGLSEQNSVNKSERASEIICISPENMKDNYCKDNSCSVAVIIDSSIYNELSSEINQYAQDLRNEFNYKVVIKDFSSSSDIKEIKKFVRNLYQNENLKGVLLVGDIPTATFFHPKVTQDTVFLSQGDTKSDFYYLDINNKCPYDSNRDAYDYSAYSCNPPNFLAPFWVSRLTPPKKLKSEWASLLKNYFKRNHEYRTGQYKYDQKFLFYSPVFNDFPKSYIEEKLNFIFKQLDERSIYGKDQIKLADYSEGSNEEYLREISKPYEFALINAHGVPTEHQYSVTPEKIINPRPMIYEIRSCSVGRFTNDDYIVGHYLFKGNSFFTTAATTPVFGPTEPNYNYMFMLTHGEPIFNAKKNFGLADNWLGDPTLRMRYLNFEYNKDSPKICFDKTEIEFGKVKIDNNIKSIADYKKASIKIVNNGKSTLKIVTDGRLKEGYYSINGLFYIEEIPPGQEKTFDFWITQISVLRDNEVWIPNEAKETGKFNGEFYVMSNDPKYPIITIPFKGEVTEMIGQNQVKTFKQEEKISCSSRADCVQKCHNIDPALDGVCVANECICAYS